MNPQYLAFSFLLLATVASAFDINALLDSLRGKSNVDLKDLAEKLKGRKMNFREALDKARGKWMEMKDELFDASVSDLKINFKDDNERKAKKSIFDRNLDISQKLTEKHSNALFGINSLSFIDFDKFKQDYLMKPIPAEDLPTGQKRIENKRAKRAAISVDLRARNAVSPVRNQANCGSCWSFATVSTLETAYFKKTGQLIDLAEQQFVNCDTGNGGCNGGWMSTAYDYAKLNGIAKESTNPYQAVQKTCTAASGATVKVANYSQLYPYDTTSMKNAIDLGYQLAVAMRAGIPEVYSYTSGILDDPTDCTDNSVDHAVTIVGYDTSGSIPYWIVRNSWSTGWGEAGYMRVKMGINYCNIETYPFFVNLL